MSSTVGYGIEVSGTYNGEEVTFGDWEEDISDLFPKLTVVRSRAEYGDEERIFLFVKSTVVEAGVKGTAAPLTFAPAKDNAVLHEVISSSGITVASPEGWYLVDYYVYS